jgi:hypothetical protein
VIYGFRILRNKTQSTIAMLFFFRNIAMVDANAMMILRITHLREDSPL